MKRVLSLGFKLITGLLKRVLAPLFKFVGGLFVLALLVLGGYALSCSLITIAFLTILPYPIKVLLLRLQLYR